MNDIIYLREKEEILKEALQRRGYDISIIDKLKKLDTERRSLIKESDELKHIKNLKTKEIAELRSKGGGVPESVQELRRISDTIKTLDERRKELEEEFRRLWAMVPNIPHPSVPQGKDERENKVVREVGDKREFSFKPKPHWKITEKLGIIDFNVSSRMSGSRFFTYRGAGARLERALLSFFLDLHTTKHGYIEFFTPFLVTRQTMFNSAQIPFLEEEMYKIEKDNLFLIPTAEVPLLSLHSNEIIPIDELPKKYVAYSACFRREAGSYGKDVKGMIRTHQFNKVELFKFVSPEESYNELINMMEDIEDVLRLLELPYRVIELCTGDLGFASSKTYDFEVWSPGVERWLEVSSLSNTESFQARRANIKVRRKDGRLDYVHTLNGSGLATPRTFIGIIENYQQEDGKIKVPDVLVPYMGGMEVIG